MKLTVKDADAILLGDYVQTCRDVVPYQPWQRNVPVFRKVRSVRGRDGIVLIEVEGEQDVPHSFHRDDKVLVGEMP